MRGSKIIICAFLLSFIAVSGCIFKKGTYKGVIGYRHEMVFLTHDKYYKVGVLPDDWEHMGTKARTISFYNSKTKGSISTDAFCGRSIGDRKLTSLAGELVSSLENRKVVTEENIELDGRGALRQKVSGSFDGVSMSVDLVVVRKDGCVFDFYLTAPPDVMSQSRQEFETFFEGFRFN